jgi:hypothetical protein
VLGKGVPKFGKVYAAGLVILKSNSRLSNRALGSSFFMPKIRALLKSEIIIILSLIVFAGFIFFWRLGEPALKDWDEAIYAEVSKEILLTGNWIDLQCDGKPWLEKPPLTLWLTAILYRLFGVNEFWSRGLLRFGSRYRHPHIFDWQPNSRADLRTPGEFNLTDNF